MGKLGGRELTAASDLDLIVVYDFPDDATGSDGERALAPSAYFTRLTQRLIAAISAPTGEGTLYEVDMRLRPSGNSGPVAASVASFASYQSDSAWTWEHMALTRARVISGDEGLKERVEAIIAQTLCQPRDGEKLIGDVVEMRRRIDEEKGSADPWQIKTVPGGLVDLEFIAQYLQLRHAAENPAILDTNTAAALRKITDAGLIDEEAGEELLAACTLYHNLTQVLRLSLETQVDIAAMPRGLQLLLARAAALPDFSVLAAHLAETQGRVRAIFGNILGADPWKERG
jgi:glutamate-ammonia-ligase adenylyltransferase